MSPQVESISAQTVQRPVPKGGETSGDFFAAYRIALAEELGKSERLTEKLTASSQKNDASDTGAAGSADADAPAALAELDIPLTPAVQTSLSSSKTAPSPLPSQADEMVVDLRYGRMILSPAVMGFGNETKIFLPLVQVSRILDFNISSRPDTGRISGWFLDEDRRLDFNPATGTGTVDGKSVVLEADQFQAREDGVYVDSKVLSDWFPIDFSYDFSEQSVNINPRETLPFQERLQREDLMRQVRRTQVSGPVLPLKLPEYQFIDPMFVDFGFSAQYKETDKPTKGGEGQFYLLGKGDLAFMNADLYMTGDEEDRLNNFRLTLMREDPRGTMLGPLHATKVSAGDIRVPSFPVAGGGGYERGVYAGNLPLNSTGEYDSTHFAGSLSPGWDAQLFRNGVLIESQRVGADGRYAFEDVPLYYGANEFTFKFYGPQGQEKEKTERVMVGNSMMKPGLAQYQVSVTQKDEKIYDPLNRADTVDQGTDRFIGRLRYGVSKDMSVQGGLESQTIHGNRHDYVNAGVQGIAGETFLSADVVKDLAGGSALELLGQRKAGPVDLKLKQQFFNDFIRDGETETTNSIESKTDVSLSGTLKGNDTLPDLPYSLSLNQTSRKNSEERRATARIAAGLKNTYLSNSLTWKDDNSLTTQPKTAEGSSTLTSNIGKLRLRGTMNYDLYPEAEINQYNISGLYTLGREVSSEVAVSQNLENDNLVTGSVGLNWNNGKFILSPKLSYNSDDDLTAFLSFSTSFGMDARSGKTKFTSAREASQGAISARVFHDNNNNQVFDKGDTPISGAKVQADQFHRSAETDENGIAFLTGLRKNQQTDISLKKESLEDPFWEPSKQWNSIIPRPGHVEVVDIPVITTGEIDGTLYLEQPGKKRESLNHAPVQLLDADGNIVQELKSEYDGFYLFMKVPPGDYSVRLAPAFEKNLGVTGIPPVPVTIGQDGTVISGHDLVFSPRTATSETRMADARQTLGGQQPDNTPVLRWEGDNGAASAPEPAARPKPSPEQATASMFKTPNTQATLRTQAPEYTSPVLSDAAPAAAPPARPEPRAQIQNTAPAGRIRYGLHLASYRSLDAAVKGIDFQRAKHERLKDVPFTVKRTDLGAKGIWYRVFAGVSRDKDLIKASGAELDSSALYSKILTRDTGEAVIHLASYKTESAALKGIQRLKATYPELLKTRDFTTRTVDLGPGKGVWHRVIATGFGSREAAERMVEKLKTHRPYSAPMAMEAAGEKTVHTASYRTMKKAVAHLKDLVKRMGSDVPAQVSVRPVDLGKKGRWYRVLLGEYDRPEKASKLAERLKAGGNYARVMPLAGS